MIAAMLIDALALPADARVDQRVPKKLLLEQGAPIEGPEGVSVNVDVLTFAEKLEQNEAIKVYAKLPGWFKVPTPLGTYNPDWAVLVKQDGAERLFFVVETKPSLFTEDLRGKEDAKIECGKVHFQQLSTADQRTHDCCRFRRPVGWPAVVPGTWCVEYSMRYHHG